MKVYFNGRHYTVPNGFTAEQYVQRVLANDHPELRDAHLTQQADGSYVVTRATGEKG